MLKLSVIIPAYNVEQFLPKCLDSIFDQRYSGCEVICVDDGSEDRTGAILAEYAGQYENLKVVSQVNRGMSASRNVALRMAQGEYVMFVDSDDWLEEGALDSLMASVTGEDIVGFQCRKYLEELAQYAEPAIDNVSDVCKGWDYFNRERLRPREIHFVCIWQRIYRREFLLHNSLFFNEEVRRAEDDLFTTMAMWHAASIKVLPDRVYVYRIRPNSITTTVSFDRWMDSVKVQCLMADFFLGREDADMSAIYQILASNYINWFSRKTVDLYGNQDKMLLENLSWNHFRSVSITRRHKLLYGLIKISPKLFRQYERLRDAV